MFSWFEEKLNPFPKAVPVQPPKKLLAFCHHYTRGAWKPIIVMGLLSATIAIAEVSLLSFLGQVVDWLSAEQREGFFERERTRLLWMGGVLVLVLPGLAMSGE